MTVNLLKLSVGSESVESLAEWQAFRLKQVGRLFHTTRMRPRRREEVLDGGSIFWVIKGMILCRQKVTDLEEFVDDENIRNVRLNLIDATRIVLANGLSLLGISAPDTM